MVTHAATARKHDSAALPLGRLSVLGIHSPREAVLSLPAHYLDLRSAAIRANFSRLRSGETAVLRCVGSGQALTHAGPPVRSTFSVWDDQRYAVRVTVSGDARPLLARIKSGRVFHLRGEVGTWNGRLQLSNPSVIDRAWIGRVVPVYPGKPRVISPETATERIAALVDGAAIREAAAWLRGRLGWTQGDEARRLAELPGKSPRSSLEALLSEIHRPASPESGLECGDALRRLAALDLLLTARQSVERPPAPGAAIAVPDELRRQLVSATALTPTGEQWAAIREICAAMGGERPMHRLLSGDVGSGKTLVAGLACAAVVSLGGRAVWLAPNQPLADQTHRSFSKWWPDLDPARVTGDTGGLPDSPFLVGTTALNHRLDAASAPNLLVIDEARKPGMSQKFRLAGPGTHVLVATATCIPRTAALMEYGGLGVSRLTAQPVEKDIRTRIVHSGLRERLFAAIRRTVERGFQALVVYPLAESRTDQERDLKSAEGAFRLWDRHFPGRVRLAHGRMKDHEKLAIMADLREDRADLLVATSPVEAGLDLPRARHIVVVHPERLGVNALHQMRGRVARQGGVGIFDLYLPEPVKEEAMARLNILINETDGFRVAEAGMRLEGFGDFAGTRQSGGSRTFIAGYAPDFGVIEWVAGRWLGE